MKPFLVPVSQIYVLSPLIITLPLLVLASTWIPSIRTRPFLMYAKTVDPSSSFCSHLSVIDLERASFREAKVESLLDPSVGPEVTEVVVPVLD